MKEQQPATLTRRGDRRNKLRGRHRKKRTSSGMSALVQATRGDVDSRRMYTNEHYGAVECEVGLNKGSTAPSRR